MNSWLDRVAYELLATQHEVREALRAVTRRGGPPAVRTKGAGWRTVTMGIPQARALLHGAMPAPIALSSLMRAPHAQLSAALEVFGRHLLALNDPLHSPTVALEGAADVRDALDVWTDAMQWQAAKRTAQRAGVNVRSWNVPRPAPPANRAPEHVLPNVRSGFAAAASASGLRLSPREIASATQAGRDSDDSEVIDLRQGILAFAAG